MKKEKLIRKDGLDILKLICAFFIICIHKPFYGEIGKYIVAISRCAVPIFFMITGFFYKRTIDNGNENKQLIKILKLFWLSNLLYFIYNIVNYMMRNVKINVLLENIFSLNSIKNMLIFNESSIASHLWYLHALLYVLIIMKFINKYDKYKALEVATPFLLLTDLVLGKYSLVFLKTEIPFIYVRNFLFVGLPYFCIGNYIHKILESKKLDNKKYLLLLILTFSVTTILERYILVEFNVNAVRDHYISSTFLAIFLFMYFLNYNVSDRNFITKGLSKIGRSCSTKIYIFHVIIINILTRSLKGNRLYTYIAPIYIFICTVLVCLIYENLKKSITMVRERIKNER